MIFRLLVMVALLTAAVMLKPNVSSAADLPSGVSVGDIAPDISVVNIDGKLIKLATFREAKGIILVFTCNHCPFSVAYEDRIIELHNEFAPRGWPVLAVNPNDTNKVPEDSFENMKLRAKEKGFTFPYAMDATQKAALDYGARRTPHVFLLQNTPKGFIVSYIGAIDDSPRDATAAEQLYVRDAIEALERGQKPEEELTKAIGCTIKWRD